MAGKKMTNPRTLLKAWRLRASKQLGQNFLSQPNAARMIVSRSGLTAADIVAEIGAGLGALTIPLARQVRKVYAIEKDRRLIELLRTELRVAGLANVEVLEQDFLRMDLSQLAEMHDRQLVVCGNLPYNISSQILVRLIRARTVISRAVLMFQKELAERLMAPPGTKAYGRISAVLQYCADIRPLADLTKGHFHPAPRVASRVVEIKFYPLPAIRANDEDFLFRVIKAAFANRRKTLRNSILAGGLGINSEPLQAALLAAAIDPGRRAETLTPSEFVRLANDLQARIGSGDRPA
jgi:16S rRNA (adenine1518-N6/adenine1519-N6)-dimethyltransferase